MKLKISVFIEKQLENILKLHSDGYTLKSIYEDIKISNKMDFSFSTFITSLHRAKNKAKMQDNINNKISNTLDNKDKLINEENHESQNISKAKSLKSMMQTNPFDEE